MTEIAYREPPSTHVTFKVPLKDIFRANPNQKDDPLYLALNSAIERVNLLVFRVRLFLMYYLLDKYHSQLPLPTINDDMIRMAFKALVKPSCGRKPKGDNGGMYEEFLTFYQTHFNSIFGPDKVDGTNLSQILMYVRTQILTNIETNIKVNYPTYVRRFVNAYFRSRPEIQRQLETLKGRAKADFQEELRKDLYQVKEDLLNGTKESRPRYHPFLNTYRHLIIPCGSRLVEQWPEQLTLRSIISIRKGKASKKLKLYDPRKPTGQRSVVVPKALDYDDLKADPQRYLPFMIRMNLELEKIGAKQFHWFPLKSEHKPMYIPIDTTALVHLFVNNGCQEYVNNIGQYQEELWERFFHMDHKIFGLKRKKPSRNSHRRRKRKQKPTRRYVFNYQIATDGYGVSIQMLRKDLVESTKATKARLKEARAVARKRDKDLTQDQIDEAKRRKTQKAKEAKKQSLKDYNNLSSEEQEEQKQAQNTVDGVLYEAFPYFNQLPPDKLEELKKSHIILIDPGKRSLLTMMDYDGGKFLTYSHRQRLRETKQIKYRRHLQNYRGKKGILKIQKQANAYQFNSKTCQLVTCKAFITGKAKMFDQLAPLYADRTFRQYHWYAYLNNRKSLGQLLDRIEAYYGKAGKYSPNGTIKIIIGDWSSRVQLRGHMPTPGMALKRKLAERFEVFTIDEFRTSKLHYQTEQACDNLYLPDAKGEDRKIHSILTYPMENERLGCINRDRNAVKNMRKIVSQFFKTGDRPQRYCRGYELPETKKPTTKRIETQTVAVSSQGVPLLSTWVTPVKELGRAIPAKFRMIEGPMRAS